MTHHTHERSDATRGSEAALASLDDLDDFKVHEDDPDIRGWDVVTENGEKIGEVDELIVDTAAMKVRYFGVDIDEDLLGDRDHDSERDRLLVPIGYATLNEEEDQIRVRGIGAQEMGTWPLYSRGGVTRENENEMLRRVDPEFQTDVEGDDWYDRPHFDDRSIYPSRAER